MNKRSERILKAIEDSKLSYGELSNITGIPKSALQRYATGETEKVPIDRIEAIAKATHVSASYLMGWEDIVHTFEYDISNAIKHTENEKALLDNFSKLNFKGETEAIKRVHELIFVPEYTENQEELWKLIPGSLKAIEKPVDCDDDSDNDSTDTFTSQPFLIKISDLVSEEDIIPDDEKKENIDKPYLEPKAAHERTDIEVTDEMRKHDDDIMDDDDFWKDE